MKKRLLALDVSTTKTGYALMDENQKLIKSGEFSIEDRELSDAQYATVITKEVFKLVNKYEATDLVIEDIYFAKNVEYFRRWARVHGAIALTWIIKKGTEPRFIMASEARPLVGLNARATKIEIQLEVCKRYKLVESDVYFDYCGQFSELLKKRKNKTYNKNQYDYRIKKLSEKFEAISKVSEHLADSVILGIADLIKNKR